MGPLLTEILGSRRYRVEGVVRAIVIGIDDPQGLSRVRLRLPPMDKPYETDWARIVVPFGTQAVVPEMGDEVLVVFERSDLRFPYVLGRLSNLAKPN
jgi:uncharacterized protein involved in type VI secretion and phage assembly